mmetsp:Transcript_932/g.2176  ORF Transcript_932/g.2176 Transcript_932/m.2176 type:complete len:201 (-) Transcript_932:1577-2179(-)
MIQIVCVSLVATLCSAQLFNLRKRLKSYAASTASLQLLHQTCSSFIIINNHMCQGCPGRNLDGGFKGVAHGLNELIQGSKHVLALDQTKVSRDTLNSSNTVGNCRGHGPAKIRLSSMKPFLLRLHLPHSALALQPDLPALFCSHFLFPHKVSDIIVRSFGHRFALVKVASQLLHTGFKVRLCMLALRECMPQLLKATRLL